AVYIFGSQVEGRADEWSDIDLAAFMDGVESWDLQRRTEVMAHVQFEVGFDVEPHLFPASALQNPERGSFAEYILKHGVRIGE
ncbi:MAG TPA: nucleotidyltransferase domain-containing protein, partial [bacterium]|nr:nucleotidyltransferase domain-containing protein [bacterium]